MKIYAAALPAIFCVDWLRRHAAALTVVALVALATLGVGVAQVLYSNAAPHAVFSEAILKANVVLDQHERHPIVR